MVTPGLVVTTGCSLIKINSGKKYFFLDIYIYIVFCKLKILNRLRIIVLKNKYSKTLKNVQFKGPTSNRGRVEIG